MGSSSVSVECCCEKSRTLGVILDLDGTLLDTERATKGVLAEFLEKKGKELDKEKEENKRFGMTLEYSSARIVKDYDLPLTPAQFIDEIVPMYREKWAEVKPLPGASRLINHLHKQGVPLALASNSTSEYINAKISHQQGWKECFWVILGSDQVKSGKPSPDLFIEAGRRLGVDAAHCLVIEDSLVGVKAGSFANMKVLAVPSQKEVDSASMADSVIHSLLEFEPEQWGLPPFEDRVDDALPIEPVYLNGFYSNGSLSEITDGSVSSLPDQVVGVFFGWAEFDMHTTCKIVVAIGWTRCSCTAKREFQICVVDGDNGQLFDQKLQAGEKSNTNLEILEEDKAIASAALDLPLFTRH
ncbi:hypothetical protein ACFE04_029374 [Oxalis oulophora]